MIKGAHFRRFECDFSTGYLEVPTGSRLNLILAPFNSSRLGKEKPIPLATVYPQSKTICSSL